MSGKVSDADTRDALIVCRSLPGEAVGMAREKVSEKVSRKGVRDSF